MKGEGLETKGGREGMPNPNQPRHPPPQHTLHSGGVEVEGKEKALSRGNMKDKFGQVDWVQLLRGLEFQERNL